MNATKFFNMTNAPTCNSQNHIATQSLCSFISPSWFPSPSDLQATFHSLPTETIMAIYDLSRQFLLSISNPAHIFVHGAALTALMFNFSPF